MNVQIKHAQCGAKVMVIKDFNIETPAAFDRWHEICQHMDCAYTNDPCEALISVLKGTPIIITKNPEVREVIKIMKAMISIGRAFQVVEDVCRRSDWGISALRELELECPDYSYPRALFLTDELSPSIHFLRAAIERASLLDNREKVTASCGIEVPKELRNAYPFSQMECPIQTRERIKERLEKLNYI